MRFTPLAWILLVLALILGGVLWYLLQDPPEGGATPEEVLERLGVATLDHDWAGLLPVTLPEQRRVLAFGLGVSGPMGSARVREQLLPAAKKAGDKQHAQMQADIERLQKAHRKILDQHGIPSYSLQHLMEIGADPAVRRKLAEDSLANVDLEALLTDVSSMLKSIPDGIPEGAGPFANANFVGRTVVIDGDTATATPPAGGKPLTLKKLDGRWYADLVAFQ